MSDNVIALRNDSNIAKHVYEGEIRHTLQPYEVRQDVPAALANKFLTQHPRFVREYVQVRIPEIPGEDRMWIANGTGNPWVNRTIFVPGPKSEDGQVEIPHPLLSAEPLHFSWYPGQIVIRNATEGDMALNPLPISFVLPPFERIPVSNSIARFMLQRDALQPFWAQGKCKVVRAPTAFEPNETWTIENMAFYASMLDESGFNPERLKAIVGGATLKDKEDPHAAKHRLWQHLFHKLCDDEFTPPTQEAFEAYKRTLGVRK